MTSLGLTWIVDDDLRTKRMDARLAGQLGWSAGGVIGLPWAALMDRSTFLALTELLRSDDAEPRTIVALRHANGDLLGAKVSRRLHCVEGQPSVLDVDLGEEDTRSRGETAELVALLEDLRVKFGF